MILSFLFVSSGVYDNGESLSLISLEPGVSTRHANLSPKN